MNTEITFYGELLADIKQRVRLGQHRAVLSANAELILMYWEIGRLITSRPEREGWGAGVIPRLATDLKNELPEEKGFSERNLGYMIHFAREYGTPPILQPPAAKLPATVESLGTQFVPEVAAAGSETPILQPPVAKLENSTAQSLSLRCLLRLPWSHNLLLLQKLKDLPTRLWYARQALEHGWSRETLLARIKRFKPNAE